MTFAELPISRRQRSTPARKAPDRNRFAWKPRRPESLEDRLAPASNIITAGGLEFLASANFDDNGTKYTLSPGDSVSVGYEPEGQEVFQPLLQFQLDNELLDEGSFSLETNPSELSFTVSYVKLSAVAVEGSQSLPIPIWQSSGSGFPATFGLAQLQSTGAWHSIPRIRFRSRWPTANSRSATSHSTNPATRIQAARSSCRASSTCRTSRSSATG